GTKVVGHSGSEPIANIGEGFRAPSGFIPSVGILAERMQRLNNEGAIFNEQRVDFFEQCMNVSAQQRVVGDNYAERTFDGTIVGEVFVRNLKESASARFGSLVDKRFAGIDACKGISLSA